MIINEKKKTTGLNMVVEGGGATSTMPEENIFEDDFREGLQNWITVKGTPEIVNINDDAYVKIIAGGEVDSIDLFSKLTLPGFYRFSFDLKKNEPTDLGGFYINFADGGLKIELSEKTTNTIRYSQVMAFDQIYNQSLKIILDCQKGSVLFGNIRVDVVTATHVEKFNDESISLDWCANPNCSYSIKGDKGKRFLEVKSDYEVGQFPIPPKVNILSRKEITSGYNDETGEYYGAALTAVFSADASDNLNVSVYGDFNNSYNLAASSDNGKGLNNELTLATSLYIPYNNHPEKAMITYGVGVCSYNQPSVINTIYIKEIRSYVGVVGKQLVLNY